MSQRNSKIAFGFSTALGSGMLLYGIAVSQPLVALGGLGIALVSWANIRSIEQKAKKLNKMLTV